MFHPLSFPYVRGIAALTSIIAAAALLLIAGCGGGNGSAVSLAAPSSPSAPAADPTRTTGQYGALQFTLTTPKTTYTADEVALFTLTATNTGPKTVNLDLGVASSPALLVRQGETEVYRSPSAGAAVEMRVSLEPGASRTYELNWRPGVPPSRYSVVAYLVGLVDNQAVPDGALLGPAPLTITIK